MLSLLAETAASRPLVCLVDDAQWLDDASAQVLGFVARRLLAESVLLVFAVREAADERLFPALPTLTLEGLIDADARGLLRPPPSRGTSTRRFVTGSSPRPAVTRSRCWNWHADSAMPSSPAVTRCRPPDRCPRISRTTTYGGCALCRSRPDG